MKEAHGPLGLQKSDSEDLNKVLKRKWPKASLQQPF